MFNRAMKNNRFVIQEHRTEKDTHWDLMLEMGNSLQTYRLNKEPKQILHQPAEAVKIFDHPLKFLKYEGPVNKGRGQVHIVDCGTYQADRSAANVLKLTIKGQILNGCFRLNHIKNDLWEFASEKTKAV